MHKGEILTLDVTDLAFGGKGISKIDELVVFIDGALPGQSVEAKITTKKRRHAEAKCLKVLTRSTDEVKTPYQNIPGAPWANLPVETQQQYKKQQVTELFQKFAETDITAIFDTYIASPDTWHYRNKMEYSFGPTEEAQDTDGNWEHTGFGLGSKKRGQFWLVENLEKDSGLFDKAVEDNLSAIREWAESIDPTPYNSRTNAGFWRHLLIRKSVHEDQLLINVITGTKAPSGFKEKATAFFTNMFGDRLKGLYWTQSDDLGNPSAHYQDRTLLHGDHTLTESLSDLSFEISIDSFFQTNVLGAEKLYQKAVSYLKPDTAQVLDLFCGTGTISQIVARAHPDILVTGVEIVEPAVEDAKRNAKLNGIENIGFVAADVNKWLKENTPNKQTTIFLDPPRAGISPKALKRIIEATPPQIVYVSCNPATMARDTAQLKESGYILKNISLVDQFPHTSHVEVVGNFVLS